MQRILKGLLGVNNHTWLFAQATRFIWVVWQKRSVFFALVWDRKSLDRSRGIGYAYFWIYSDIFFRIWKWFSFKAEAKHVYFNNL